jgi:regulation of enolase protein 1 (concanavalin A-like superfamily)
MLTQALSGDGTIITRVVSMTNTNPWAKAGIMIREGTAANAKHAFCFVTPVTTNGVGFIRRTATGGMSTYTGGSKNTAPRWLRLVRSGTTITASESVNGTTWTTVGTVTVSLANPVRIGFAVTAGDNNKMCTAVFDVVSITPSGNG